jgi:invasion protein IalB
MSRKTFASFATVSKLALAILLAATAFSIARTKPKNKPGATAEQSGAATEAGKPLQLGSYGDWGVYLARGEKTKTCYALATPKDRAPAGLNRDPAYVFVANRPGENVRQEISIIMGFPVKEDSGHAEVGGSSFALIAKGPNAWIKNQAEETHFVDALKKGSKLIIKAASQRGRVTTDSYSLAGLSQALEKIEKECP